MTKKSPFTLHRFEHQQEQLYFLPSEPFAMLEQPKSLFLIGSRGTGKTTLLQALNWREQLTNSALQEKLSGKIHDRKYIGIYVKVPLMHVPAFEKWTEAPNPILLDTLFSTYLDFVWLEELGVAIAELLDQGILNARPRHESSSVQAIFEREPTLSGRRQAFPITFRQMSQHFYALRRELENLAIANARISAEELSERFPLSQIGAVGRLVSPMVGEFCASYSKGDSDGPWNFRICLDEAECLSERQQKVMNTMVRLSTAPLSYVISYVSPVEEMSDTCVPNLTLQSADRNILRLDEISDLQFQELCVGVATVRLSYVAGHNVSFDPAFLLGRLSVNQLLHSIITSSVSKQARDLLASAEQLKSTPFGNIIQDTTERDIAPIYQAYLIDRLGLKPPSPDSPRWQMRNQDSAEIRKKMVAAYLCICSELAVKIRYASERMLFQMSDNCIRDFLAQMDGIYLERALPVDDFLKSPIPPEQQDRALRKVSAAKHDFISSSGVSSPNETRWLVDALGDLTARLHSGPPSARALQATERGVFVLKVPQDTSLDQVVRVIYEAAEAGFLKLVDEPDGEVKFRVHCSLAAYFGFSYRGSYYTVAMKAKDLSAIYQEANFEKRRKLIMEIVDSLNRIEPTLPLFGESS